MLLILFLILAFGLGSIPFSFIICKRVMGIDLREHGSGNLGATNVFRTLGPGWGGICLFLDMAKGAAAVGLMTWLVSTWPEGQATPLPYLCRCCGLDGTHIQSLCGLPWRQRSCHHRWCLRSP